MTCAARLALRPVRALGWAAEALAWALDVALILGGWR